MACFQVSDCSWGHGCTMQLLPHKSKATCIFAQETRSTYTMLRGNFHATLMITLVRPSTEVQLKIQMIQEAALPVFFQWNSSSTQQIPKSFITAPLRCSFWPQLHEWFMWVYSFVQPTLNWVCRASSTKGLWARRGSLISILSGSILLQTYFWHDTSGKHYSKQGHKSSESHSEHRWEEIIWPNSS